MPTAVSSTSPLSAITPATAAPAAKTGAASPAKSTDASTDASTETSDFNSVLSPMMKAPASDTKAAGTASSTAESTPTVIAKPGSDAASVPPEGLELTAVLQQTTAAKGNPIPVDGKGLPVLPEDATVKTAEVAEDPTLQIALPVAKSAGEGELPVQKSAAQPPKADGKKTDDELLANLAAPTPVTTPVVTTAATSTEAASVGDKSAKGDEAASDATTDAQAAAQQALLSVVPDAVTAQVANAPAAKATQLDSTDTESQLSAILPSNSRASAQHSDTSKSSVETALQSGDANSKASTTESALTDLLPTSNESGKNDDAVKAGSFGRLLETQATANSATQQPTADGSTLSSKQLTGAVAYRMEGNTQVATTLVNQPVDSPQWTNEIGERVVWFGANKIQHAEIELDPPELGPLQVRISTQNDQTSISFTSHHAGVREALDQSMPKLKEMFSDQGLNLVQADVGDRRGSQQHQPFEMGDASGTGRENTTGDDEADGSAAAKPSSTTKMRLGLVDAYA